MCLASSTLRCYRLTPVWCLWPVHRLYACDLGLLEPNHPLCRRRLLHLAHRPLHLSLRLGREPPLRQGALSRPLHGGMSYRC